MFTVHLIFFGKVANLALTQQGGLWVFMSFIFKKVSELNLKFQYSFRPCFVDLKFYQSRYVINFIIWLTICMVSRTIVLFLSKWTLWGIFSYGIFLENQVKITFCHNWLYTGNKKYLLLLILWTYLASRILPCST